MTHAQEPWHGVKGADSNGPACMQSQSRHSRSMLNVSEDCLVMNIWTPSLVPAQVGVWMAHTPPH